AIRLEPGDVLLLPGRDAHEFQVDEDLIHLGVADALTNAQRASMHAVRTGYEGSHRIGGSEAAVAVAVPVHADFLAGRFDDFFHHELDQREGAHRSGVSGGVAEDDSARAAVDRSGVKALDHFRIAAG